jgi:hypothetical protein
VVADAGATAYRLIATERDGQWFARAERLDTARPFGLETSGPTEAVAIGRLTEWLAWQHEHAAALEALQAAERAYHRTVAASAFVDPSGGTDATGLRKEALDAIEASRLKLDEIRARRPHDHEDRIIG